MQELVRLRREQPGTFEDEMRLRVGGRVFRNFKPSDLQRIEKAYQNYSIVDLTGGGAVLEATIWALRYVERLAQRHRDTGAHSRSFSVFYRSVGGQDVETTQAALPTLQLPVRPVTSIINEVPYALRLENVVHHGRLRGFLFQTSRELKKEFGRAIQVKFDVLAGSRLGKGGAMPRLQIANPGDLRGRSHTPGKRRRRR